MVNCPVAWLIDMNGLNTMTLIRIHPGMYISVETALISLNAAVLRGKNFSMLTVSECTLASLRELEGGQYLTSSFGEQTRYIKWHSNKVQAHVITALYGRQDTICALMHACHCSGS